jgi:hypothetical protein
MKPFENESEEIEIDGLKIENRLDRITIYGRIDITKDEQGRLAASILRGILGDILFFLEVVEKKLPDKIHPPKDPIVKPNPFVEGE